MKTSDFINGALAIGVAAILAYGTVVIPQVTQTREDIGKLSERSDSIKELMTEKFKRVDDRFDAIDIRFDTIDKTLSSINLKLAQNGARAGQLEDRLVQAEADATKILRQMGIRFNKGYSGVMVGNKFYVLPHNKASEKVLVNFGMTRHRITPAVSGYLYRK